MKKWMLILSCLFLSVGLTIAQTTAISGTVVDDTGETVTGASVVVKGTTIGVITDIDGKFSINVPAGRNTLVFSLVGMKTKELSPSSNMKVTMEHDSGLLDEVMVVAYGTAKRSAFTGSAAVVKSEEIKNIQVGSVSRALAGRAAGVLVTSNSGRPGSDAVVRVRGTGSINAVSDPLYVVDGVPFEGALNTINQQDIESLTILKDAAANSLYGARGANGVILITTKSGQLGGKTKVTLDAKWGINSRAVPLYQMITNPADYYETYWNALRNQQHYSLGNSWVESGRIASRDLVSTLGGYNNYNVPDGQLIDPVTGRINSGAKLLYQDSWEDAIFENGLRQEYQANVTGGSDKSTYFFSMGYLGDEGIVDNSAFNRFSARLRLDHNVNSWMKIGANAAYTKTETKFTNEDSTEGSNGFYIVQSMAPIYPVFSRDNAGNRFYEKNGTPVYDFGDGMFNPFHKRPISSMANPVASQILDQDRDDINFFSGNAFAEVRFLDGFKFRANVNYDVTDNLGVSYLNGVYGQFRDDGGISTRYTERISALFGSQQLTWAKTYGDHNIDALLVHESYSYTYNFVSAQKGRFFDPNNIELNGAILNPLASSYENNYRLESYLSRVQYDYLSKYFVSGGFRTDGSSRFHKDNRWGKFWSLGGSWLLTREKFMADVKWLNELKYKISYGTQGNDLLFAQTSYKSVSPWATQFIVKPNGDNLALEPYYTGNKNISWEKSKSFNTGFEFGLLSNRIRGGVEYFNRTTSNMLFERKTPSSYGDSGYPDNIGDMVNKGIEFELSGDIVQTKDLVWTMSVNATNINNEVVKLAPELREEGVLATLFLYKEGKSIYDYYLRDFAGLTDEGQSLWYTDVLDSDDNPTGERTTTTDYVTATRYYQGCALPDVYGGISSTLTWKDFDLTIMTNYQFGGTGFDYAYYNMMHGGTEGQAWHKDILNSWTPENTNTNTPRLEKGDTYVNGLYSDRWLVSSDFFSIQNITFGYNLPKSLLKRFDIAGLRVYGVADNVALFSKRKGYDPRESASGVNGYGRYTQVRTVSFGVNLQF